ncbi:MAG: hypothetical protein JXA06_07515 [Bacteroidetes bacterium]|nr:hypothetical protein [Bacteroidota bacterium]
MESLVNILLFIGGSQGLLLSAVLISVKRGNRKANRILAVLLLLFSFLILSYAIGHQQEHRNPSYTHRWLVHAIFFHSARYCFFIAGH